MYIYIYIIGTHIILPNFFPCFSAIVSSRIFFLFVFPILLLPGFSFLCLCRVFLLFFFPSLMPHFSSLCFSPFFMPHVSSQWFFFHSFLPYVSYLLSIFVILHGFKYYALRTVARVQRKQAWTGGDDFLCLAQTYMKLYGITERSSLRSKLATQTSIKFWENGCWWQEISRNGCGMWDYPDVQKIDAVLLQYLRLCSQNLWNNCDTNKRVCLT